MRGKRLVSKRRARALPFTPANSTEPLGFCGGFCRRVCIVEDVLKNPHTEPQRLQNFGSQAQLAPCAPPPYCHAIVAQILVVPQQRRRCRTRVTVQVSRHHCGQALYLSQRCGITPLPLPPPPPKESPTLWPTPFTQARRTESFSNGQQEEH